MIIDEYAPIKCGNRNKAFLISRGYEFVGISKEIIVHITDLPISSEAIILVKCDYCDNNFNRKYKEVISGRKIINKDACGGKCLVLKAKDSCIIKYGVESPNRIGRSKILKSTVKQAFMSRNYIMHGDYINAKEKISYTCSLHEGHIQEISYDSLRQGKGCWFCGNKNKSKNQIRYNIEEIRDIFYKKGCKLISNTYESSRKKLEYMCENGHIGEVILYEFINDSYCRECTIDSLTKHNHWNWKGGVTSENEKARKSNQYAKWRTGVYERDSYTYQCCLSKKDYLHAHHIRNFSENIDIRFDVKNGITLCQNCHSISIPDSFHYIYTQFNNDEKQLAEYIAYKRKKLGINL